MAATAYIALGSNLGDRASYLRCAINRIGKIPMTRIKKLSRIEETDTIGGPKQGPYLNGVAKIETGLSAQRLMDSLRQIEQALGRPADHPHWGARTVDLDIIDYNGLCLTTPALSLPHPRAHQRPFVLRPLTQIAPHWIHPVLGKTVFRLLDEAAAQ